MHECLKYSRMALQVTDAWIKAKKKIKNLTEMFFSSCNQVMFPICILWNMLKKNVRYDLQPHPTPCSVMQTSSLNIWPTVFYRSMIWTAVLFTLKMFFQSMKSNCAFFFAKLLSSFTLSNNQPSTQLFSTPFFYHYHYYCYY